MKASSERFMKEALRLAKRGLGRTSPNPAVGCVVVKGGRIIGRGYHRRAGLPHAEAEALIDCGSAARGADIYVTLEPCCHAGRTPPCVEAIIRAGIRRVFVATKDPNPLVSGKGISRLRRAGIEVLTGVLEGECRRINEPYAKYVTKKSPFVTLKLASSLDGRIATPGGESRWITGIESRRRVHRMRSLSDCVMVGIGTVLADDPELTVRHSRGRNPLKAVLDSSLRMPLKTRLLGSSPERLIVFASRDAPAYRVRRIQKTGAEVVLLPGTREGVSLRGVMKELYKREVVSLLIEGGGRLAASAIRSGMVDKVSLFLSPLILGSDSRPSVGALGVRALKVAPRLERMSLVRSGPDILIEGYLKGG